MQHSFGLKHLLTLQVRVTMESIPANTFSYREEKQESLFQYLMEWFMISFGFLMEKDSLLCPEPSQQ